METVLPSGENEEKAKPTAAERFYSRYPREHFKDVVSRAARDLGEGQAEEIIGLVDKWGGAPAMLTEEQKEAYRLAIDHIESERRAEELRERMSEADVHMGAIAAKRVATLEAVREGLPKNPDLLARVQESDAAAEAQRLELDELMQPGPEIHIRRTGRRPSSASAQYTQSEYWNGSLGGGTPGNTIRVNAPNVRRK